MTQPSIRAARPITLAVDRRTRQRWPSHLPPSLALAEMLAEGARRAAEASIENIRWVQALAEEIPTLELPTFKLVTFGQSFHWTAREQVAEAVYDILEPGGALALISHEHEGRPQPLGPAHPPIPHEAIGRCSSGC